MTPPTPQQIERARVLYQKLHTPNYYLDAMDIEIIAAALADERQRVWEEAATHIVEEEDDFTTFIDSGGPIPDAEFDVKKFADWCRQRGGGG